MIKIELKDITKSSADAIVNAANSRLANGAGVAAAIERAGGQQFKSDSERLVREKGPIKTGGIAAQKSAGDLFSKYVINAVGPIYGEDPANQASQLFSCYYDSVKEAKNLGLQSIAFPAISCGIFAYPPKEAAEIAISALLKASQDFDFSNISLCFLPRDLELAECFANSLNNKTNPLWRLLSENEKSIVFMQEYPISLNLAAAAAGVDFSNILNWYQEGLMPVRKSIGEPEVFWEGLVIVFLLARLGVNETNSLKKSKRPAKDLEELIKKKYPSGAGDIEN